MIYGTWTIAAAPFRRGKRRKRQHGARRRRFSSRRTAQTYDGDGPLLGEGLTIYEHWARERVRRTATIIAIHSVPAWQEAYAGGEQPAGGRNCCRKTARDGGLKRGECSPHPGESDAAEICEIVKGPSEPAALLVSAYRCSLPGLAGFAVFSRAGPDPWELRISDCRLRIHVWAPAKSSVWWRLFSRRLD